MADGDSFYLRLIDKLTGPADRMAKSLSRITGSASAATSAVDRLGNAQARAAGKIGLLARAREKAARIRGGADAHQGAGFIGPRRQGGVGFELRGLGRDLLDMNKGAGEAMSKWGEFSSALAMTPIGKLGASISWLGGKLYDLGAMLLSTAWSAAKMGWALGAIGAAYVTKEVVELAAFAERARYSLAQLTGSTAQGNEAFERARRVAGQLGMGVEQVAQSFIELRAAQFSIEQAEALTKLSADLSTVTGHADAAGRIINAISKIQATGRLQGDELMMLAEAGLSLDMVYSRLEKTMGKSRDQILKMQSAGKITASQAITAIQEAIIDKTHEKTAGEAAGRYAMSTLSGAWQTLKNAPRNFLLKVGERIDTGPLTKGMRALIGAFEGAGGDQIVAFVNKMVVGMGRVMTVLPHFAAGFSDGFGGVLKALSFEDRDYEGAARKAGGWLATFFEKSIEFGKRLVPVLEAMLGSFGKSFNLEEVMNTLAKINFGQLAKDMAVIAAAAGKIMGYAAKSAPVAVGAVEMGVSALTNPNYGGPFGNNGPAMAVDKFGNDMGVADMIKKAQLPEEVRGQGLFARGTRSVLGMDEGSWYDPTGATEGYAATDTPTLAATELASRAMHSETTIVIQGAQLSEQELVKRIQEALDKSNARAANQMRAALP